MVRDARTRHTDVTATMAMWDSVRAGEEKYIFPYQEKADVMFNSSLLYEIAVLKKYAYPMLKSIPTGQPVLHALAAAGQVPQLLQELRRGERNPANVHPARIYRRMHVLR